MRSSTNVTGRPAGIELRCRVLLLRCTHAVNADPELPCCCCCCCCAPGPAAPACSCSGALCAIRASRDAWMLMLSSLPARACVCAFFCAHCSRSNCEEAHWAHSQDVPGPAQVQSLNTSTCPCTLDKSVHASTCPCTLDKSVHASTWGRPLLPIYTRTHTLTRTHARTHTHTHTRASPHTHMRAHTLHLRTRAHASPVHPARPPTPCCRCPRQRQQGGCAGVITAQA